MLAQKPDMTFAWESHSSASSLIWGSLLLEFATELLFFVRSQYASLNPPLASALAGMPSERDLLRQGQDDLASRVERFADADADRSCRRGAVVVDAGDGVMGRPVEFSVASPVAKAGLGGSASAEGAASADDSRSAIVMDVG